MHLEVREKNRKRKYFLSHSYRKGGKVRKERIYLGTNLAPGILDKRRRLAALELRKKLMADSVFPQKELPDMMQMTGKSDAIRGAVYTANQEKELFTALFGRSEIPLKYQYLKEGAQNWIDAAASPKYAIQLNELNLVRKISRRIRALTSYENVFDIGCGDGKKARVLLNQRIGYFPIDLSEDMLEVAIKENQKGSRIAIPYVRDFEEGNFADVTYKYKNQSNLFIFLGNTVGNSFNKARLLENIRESLAKKDYLLIGVEQRRNTMDTLRHYDNEEVFKYVTGTTRKLLSVSDALDIRFNRRKKQVEIRCSPADNPRKKILVLVSYKPTKKEMHSLLENNGFEVVEDYEDEKKTSLLVLCRPKQLK